MNEFSFLLTNSKYPEGLQTVKDFEVIKGNIVDAIKNVTRVDISMLSTSFVLASTAISKIARKDNSYFLLIDRLIPQSANTVLKQTRKAVLTFKVDNVLLGFMCNYAGYQDSSSSIILTFPEKIFRIQRRMFYRVSPTNPTQLEILVDSAEGEAKSLPTLDISEGGVSFYVRDNHGFEIGETYPSSLLMSDGAVVPLSIIIRSIFPLKKKLSGGYSSRIGSEFANLDSKTREIIAKFVFFRQMEDIQKSRKVRG